MYGPSEIMIRTTVEPPKTPITEKVSFALTVHVEIISAHPIRSSNVDLLKPESFLRPEDLKEFLDLTYSQLRVTVNLGGAQIAPKRAQSLDETRSANWSIKLNDPGPQIGFIHVESRDPRTSVFQRDTALPIEVYEAPMTAFRLATISSAWVGLAVALSGLVTFVWGARDRRKAARKKEQAESHRIIIDPDRRR